MKSSEIKLGMPATMHVGSDRYVMLVYHKTDSGKTVYVKYAKKEDGHWIDCGKDLIKVRKDKSGNWFTVGEGLTRKLVLFGVADPYRDPSF